MCPDATTLATIWARGNSVHIVFTLAQPRELNQLRTRDGELSSALEAHRRLGRKALATAPTRPGAVSRALQTSAQQLLREITCGSAQEGKCVPSGA